MANVAVWGSVVLLRYSELLHHVAGWVTLALSGAIAVRALSRS